MKSGKGLSVSCFLVLASFGSAAQGNSLPSDVTCAAAFSVSPTSKAPNPGYDRMQQYFQALVNLRMASVQAASAVDAEIDKFNKMTLEERIPVRQNCRMRYLNENRGRLFSPKMV